MKRRDFLKLVGALPFVGLVVETKRPVIRDDFRRKLFEEHISRRGITRLQGQPIGVAIEDIPKDGYGWMRAGILYDEALGKKIWGEK